jgi:hypothetical protein
VPLVGDAVLAARELIPDMPPTLPTPTATYSVVGFTGSTLPTGTYFVQATQRNPWGETLPAAESGNLTIGANQGIQITSALLPGATVIRAYITIAGGVAGTEQQFVESAAAPGFAPSPFTISAPPTNAGAPPTRNTAYNPDLDGGMVSAGTMFRWLSRGLTELSQAAEGIRDYSGVPTTPGQPLYVLNGNWTNITDIWYNGYWLQGGQRGYFFRRNAITSGVLTSASVSVQDNRTILEVFPQPDRTAGTDTLTTAMTATDTSLVVTTGNFLLLPFGFIQLSTTNATPEIMSYSSITTVTTIGGLVRGLGGTGPAQAWAAGATVTELNLVVNGHRTFATTYAPGQANVTLPIPSGWEDILPDYLLSKARDAEQQRQEAGQLLQQFQQRIAQWGRQNKNAARRRQIGPPSLPESITYGIPGGGWIIR